jgi:hypothetical protein
MRNRQIAVALWALIVLSAKVGSAQGGIQPLPPDEKAYGLTLGEWAAAWNEWLFSIPKASNPVVNQTDTYLGVGQHRPVWFLPAPGGTGSDVTRTFVIPTGYAILVTAGTGAQLNPPGKSTEQVLHDENYKGNYWEKLIAGLEVSVDGVPISDPKRYWVDTPLFNAVLPPNNLFGLPIAAGKDQRLAAVAVGYFYLLPPPPVGKYVVQIRLEGVNPDENDKPYRQQWTANLIIQNPNEPIP